MVTLRTGEVFLVKSAYAQTGFGSFRAQFADTRSGIVVFRNCQALVRENGAFKALRIPDQTVQEASSRQVTICTAEHAPKWFIMDPKT